MAEANGVTADGSAKVNGSSVHKEASTSEAVKEAAAPTSSDKATGLPEESQQDKENSILRLFQFYLGDSNLPFDKFLFGLSQERLSSEEKLEKPGTGWIDIARIATFKRMQPYSDFSSSQIAEILRKSAGPALEVDEKGEQLRRADPISIQRSSGQVDRSIYAKGFPIDEDEHLQILIERFFQRFYQTNAVRMRREGGTDGKKTPKGKFKGSVFVEFANKADKDAFLALDPTPTFTGQDKPLELMAKRDYLDKKAEEHNVQANYKDTPRNNFNAFTELKYLAKGGKGSSPAGKRDSAPGSSTRKRTIDYRDAQLDVENGTITNPEAIPSEEGDKDYILRFTGAADVDFADLKTKLGEVAKVRFVETSRDKSAAQYVCFEEKVTDKDLEAINKLEMLGRDGNKFEWHQATADDAKDYHLRRASFHARRSDHAGADRASGRDSRGGGRGGRGGGRGASSSGGRRHDAKPYDRKGGPRNRNDEAAEKSKAEKTADALTSSAPASSGDAESGTALKRKAAEDDAGDSKKPKTET